MLALFVYAYMQSATPGALVRFKTHQAAAQLVAAAAAGPTAAAAAAEAAGQRLQHTQPLAVFNSSNSSIGNSSNNSSSSHNRSSSSSAARADDSIWQQGSIQRYSWDTEPSYASYYSSDAERPNICRVTHRVQARVGSQNHTFSEAGRDYVPFMGTSIVKDSQLLLLRQYYR